MKQFASILLITSIASGFSAAAAEFKFASQTLTVPDGFEVELAAGPSRIERPVSMDFDELGRLYVTISSGSNDNVQKQLSDKPHSVLRLEDSDGDGKFDRKTVFADKLMLPQGAMWFDGSLYVSAPPSIWKLTDTNDDGVADKREEWFNGKTLTGCANDLHGPYLGPDGWIYWCKGAFAEQTYEVNGKPFTTRASHIFRARPDGSRIEPVITAGMDNPTAIEFTSTGERFLVGTFFQRPEQGKRDGILHAVYGGMFGKVNAVLDEHKRTGDLMPIMTHLGPSASCSVIQYRSSTWGDDFQENLFVANFNLYNITRHTLTPDGATFRTKDETFLSSDSADFHPTCILEDADGSLLVIDTGGWYKLCCPTSQLWKPELTGAIYRIRRTGSKPPTDPRGLKIDWKAAKPDDLVKLLDDQRPRVVTRAIHQLAARKGEAIPALKKVLETSKSEAARRNAVWALTQIDLPTAREAVYAAFPTDKNSHLNPEDSVSHAAIYSIGLWRDRGALYGNNSFFATVALSDTLGSKNLAMRRAAVEAYGRMGDAEYGNRRLDDAIKHDSPNDRFLEHSVIYALLELNDAGRTAEFLKDPVMQRIALIALDQMEGAKLTAEQVIPFLSSSNQRVRDAALWVIRRHPDWAPALSGYFREKLKTAASNKNDELARELATFAGDAAIQELLGEILSDKNLASDARVVVLQAIAESGLKQAPASWTKQLSGILRENDAALVGPAVAAARAIPPHPSGAAQLATALMQVAENSVHSAEVRLSALSSIPGTQPLPGALFDFVREQVQPTQPVAHRSLAASILTKAQLTEEQLTLLSDDLGKVGPMELSRLLPAFEKKPTDSIGTKLVAALKSTKALANLRPEQLKNLFAKFPSGIQEQAAPLLAPLGGDWQKQTEHLHALLASLKNGDVRRGQAVFNSPKAACSACHAIGYGGGRLGPDLTRIGQIRNERDLLEAIVFPSASFVRSYEPVVVVTTEGDDFSGVLTEDGRDEITLGTGPGAQMKVARKDIREIRPGTTSVMPAGLDEQLTQQELADLIAFLKAAK